MGFFDKIKQGLAKTREAITETWNDVFSVSELDDDFYDELEESLILADLGMETAGKVTERLRKTASSRHIRQASEAREALQEILVDMLNVGSPELNLSTHPSVILVIGVNGVGKTTTIGKLAKRLKAEGRKVLLCAGDTFRAAAADQLEIWAERAGVDIVRQHEGADPGAVLFDALQAGTFLHRAMELFFTGLSKQDRENLTPQQAHDRVDAAVAQYLRQQMPDFDDKEARFRRLFERLRSILYHTVDLLLDELSHSDFEPMDFELSVGQDIPVLTIGEPQEGVVVRGKIDRVDGLRRTEGLYLRIVDYKTGKKSFDLTDIRYGLGIQMLLYLFTLEREGQSFFGHPIVPCGVLYQPARDVILRQDRNISDEKLKAALQSELRRTGLVLNDPQVLQAMEHSALESPCYLPIGVKKDGSLSGSVATAAQLGHLGRYVDKLLHQITGEIAHGNIDADPYARGPQDSACTRPTARNSGP